MLKLSFLYLLPCLKTFYGELTLRKWSLKRRMNTKQSCKVFQEEFTFTLRVLQNFVTDRRTVLKRYVATRRAKGMGCRLFYVSLLLLQISTYKVSSHIALMLNFQALGPPPRTLTALDTLAVVEVYIILVPSLLTLCVPFILPLLIRHWQVVRCKKKQTKKNKKKPNKTKNKQTK